MLFQDNIEKSRSVSLEPFFCVAAHVNRSPKKTFKMKPNATPTTSVSIPNILRKKRDGHSLTSTEIQQFISQLTSPQPSLRLHDSQLGAFLMAVFLKGLSVSETAALTKSMTYSGYTFSWPQAWKGTMVDKHSTGGVGDKVSLILAPALAACGLRVPMISGRGLDFTGGTLDKLEAIPGFTVLQSKENMKQLLEQVGCCIVGQTEDIVPADKMMYSIRDITATVEREELIVASIISKKAAEGLDSLILDVKTGRGAMMKELESSKSLASKLVSVGKSFGMDVTALVTNMDSPLGNSVGNALEVVESLEILRNQHTSASSDLVELTCELGAYLLVSTGKVKDVKEGRFKIEGVIRDGSALKKFERMLECQGVEIRVAKEICRGNMWTYLPRARRITEIKAVGKGFVVDIDPLEVARVCHSLGCGRNSPGDKVLLEPGVVLRKKLGDKVVVGEVLMEIHEGRIEAKEVEHVDRLRNAVKVSEDEIPEISPLVIDVINN